MKRVAIISPYAPSIVSFRGALIEDLLRHSCSVHVLAPDYDVETRAAVAALGATPVDYSLERTGINPLSDLRTMWQLWRLLRRWKPDIVLAYTIKPVIYGTLAAWMARVPRRVALIAGLGYTFTETTSSLRVKLLRTVVKNLYRTALRFAHSVLFFNPDDLDEFIRGRIVSHTKTILLGGSGVDLGEWQYTPPVLHPITFTLAARLLREKGVVEFAEAARAIKQRYPETRFLLLGKVDTNPGALPEATVRQWAQEGILEWFGHVPDVRPYFAQTSVYVLPSYREGVPRSTQEAMAMARPVITTDAPGCRETVLDGTNGFLVPPRDVDALVRAMERFIQQPELIATMGQASRQLAEERFDVRKVNQKMLHVLGILPALQENTRECRKSQKV